MSVVFNNTFSPEKPIYYPSNWQSGKTSLQLYNEFKETVQFWVLRNIAEIAVSTLWVFILFILVAGAKEILRIRNLKDNDLEKMSNRKYLETQFLSGVGVLVAIVVLMSAIVLAQDWGLLIFVKGLISFTIIYFTRTYFRQGYAIIYKLLNRPQSQKFEKVPQQQTRSPTQ